MKNIIKDKVLAIIGKSQVVIVVLLLITSGLFVKSIYLSNQNKTLSEKLSVVESMNELKKSQEEIKKEQVLNAIFESEGKEEKEGEKIVDNKRKDKNIEEKNLKAVAVFDDEKMISLEEAKTKALDYINEGLMQPGNVAKIKNITKEDCNFKMTVLANSLEIISYMSGDGKMFFPQAHNIAEKKAEMEERSANVNTIKPTVQAPKSDDVKVELFVMSFCPYGVIAEKAMSPVYELLKDKVDINVKFISSIAEGENDINKVQALHGPIEGIENARQMCVEKNYGKDIFWKYVAEINEECYPIYRNGDDVYKTCWQTAARNAGINISKIDSCVESEGADLIRESDAKAKSYGVTGSPSLMINGAKINATRTPDGFKSAICEAFENTPSVCEAVLEGTAAAAPAGGCGN